MRPPEPMPAALHRLYGTWLEFDVSLALARLKLPQRIESGSGVIFDFLQWLALQPFPVIVLLIACPLLATVLLASWCIQRGKITQPPHTDVVRVTTRVTNADDRTHEAAAADGLDGGDGEQMALREWDGGPPKPNWNRRSA